MVDYTRPTYEPRERVSHVYYKDIKVYSQKFKDVGIMAYPLGCVEPKLPGLGGTGRGRYVSALTDISYDGLTCVGMKDRAFETDHERVPNSLKLSKRYIEQSVV